MKIFHLAPAAADFTVSGDSYETPVYDVYDNDFYKNYCTTKSAYGLDLQGDGTWTGLNRIDENTTESGYLDGTGRFIDTSGRVVVAAPVFVFTQEAISYGMSATIDIYSSDISDFPDDWALDETVEPTQQFTMPNSERYVRFVVNLTNPNGYVYDPDNPPFTFAVRVEIDKPVMAPLYRSTARALDKLPEWMAMREIDNRPVSFGLATPDTTGAKLVNSLMGEWVDKIASDLSYLNLQLFIDTVDLNQPDWVYEYPTMVEGETLERFCRVVDASTGYELAQAGDLDEFFLAGSDTDIYFWAEAERVIFTRKQYDELHIYRSVYYGPVTTGIQHHIWNYVDDIGVLVDLSRLPGETNEVYRKRIKDVYINTPGPGIESFKQAIRRELDLWQSEGATPDSFYEGATPEVLEITDLELDPVYMSPRGIPTDKFRKLVESLAKEYPTTWGRFYWGKAIWDAAGKKYAGYNILPTIFDATPSTEPTYGIGDFDDLMVYRPDEFTGPHQFSVELTVRGKHKTIIGDSYPPVDVFFGLAGLCDINIYDNPVETQWVSVDFTTTEGTYRTEIEMSAKSDINFNRLRSTPASYDVLELFTSGGDIIDLGWTNIATGNTPTQDDVDMHINSVLSMSVHLGRWDDELATPAWTDLPSYDAVDVFWSSEEVDSVGDPTNLLNYGNYAGLDNELDAPSPELEGATPDTNWYIRSLYMRSRASNLTTSVWYSQQQFFGLTLNGGPNNEEIPVEFDLPQFEWPVPGIMAAVPNKRCEVSIISANPADQSQRGGLTNDASGADLFIPEEYISFAGSTDWGLDHSMIINLTTDPTDEVLLVQDDFERDDSDTAGRSLPTGDTGEPVYGDVLWATPASDTLMPIRIVDGYVIGGSGPDDTSYNSYTAGLSFDVLPGFVGGTLSDPAQVRATINVDVSANSDSQAIISVRNVGNPNPGDVQDYIENFGYLLGVFRSDVWLILQKTPGSEDQEVLASGSHSEGSVFEAQVVSIGNNVAVYINDTLMGSSTFDPAFFNSRGIGITIQNWAKVLDFKVEGQTIHTPSTQTVTIATVDGSSLATPDTTYPLDLWDWEMFEMSYNGGLIEGIVDENGPWRNNAKPAAPSRTYNWLVTDLSRADFGIPETADWVPTWLGVKTAYGANTVRTWLDTNIIKPYDGEGTANTQITYPENVIDEEYDSEEGVYGFGNVVVKARLRPETDPHWYPQINSGFYFLGNEERYLYANRKDVVVTDQNFTLPSPPRQGAPVIVRTVGKQLLLSDSFNRPDGEVGFTDGDGLYDPFEWTATEMSIIDGELFALAEAGAGAASIEEPFVPSDNFEIEYKPIKNGAGAEAPCIFNMTHNVESPIDSTYYALAITPGSSVVTATPDTNTFYTVLLARLSGGNISYLMTHLLDYFPNRLGVRVINGEITIIVDGSPIGSVIDPDPIPDGHAIAFSPLYGLSAVDDFKLWSLDPEFEEKEYRQVAFSNSLGELSVTNKETMLGNGTDTLYVAYPDVRDVTVTDLTSGTELVTGGSNSVSNEINVGVETDKTHAYEVEYTVNDSFFVNTTNDGLGNLFTQLVLDDATPTDTLVATYEESIYNPAAVIDLPLSPMYTSIEEGYIFLSENEYDFGRVTVRASSRTINIDSEDYIIFNLRAVDVNGNPKQGVVFKVEQDWGLVSQEIIVTNHDGYANLLLFGSDVASPGTKTINFVYGGDVVASADYVVQPSFNNLNKIVAVPSAEEVPADGVGQIMVFGKYTSANFQPMWGNTIYWKRARSLYELFNPALTAEEVVTNDEGEFEIGPFTTSDPSEPGFWFLSVENGDGNAGDVIFWHEYPMTAFGIDDLSGLPMPAIQMATPISAIPPYSHDHQFPYSYDENVVLPATPVTPLWLPPKWYSMDWFLQYQLGIISDDTDRYNLPSGYPNEAHGPYRL